MNSFTAEISGDILKSHGVDFGRPLEILARNGNRLLIRRKGHMYWSGIGNQNYAETRYMIVELKPKHTSAKNSINGKAQDFQTAEVLEEVEPGKFWQKAVKELKAKL